MIINREKGYIALVTVLIISAIALLVSIGAISLAMTEADLGLIHSQATSSYYIANSCAEEALMKLKNDLDYAGDEDLTINNQQCHIYPIQGSGNTYRIIQVQSDAYDMTNRIEVKVTQVNPETIIRSWQKY